MVWSLVRSIIDMDHIGSDWKEIIGWIMPRIKANSARSIIERLVVSASSYCIWQERNARIFRSKLRTLKQLSEVILKIVRMRMMSIQFKDRQSSRRLVERLKIEKGWTMDGKDEHG
ncbi:hypothetical protein QVD17_12069 [Tagetes erecta]|uniref:Reverse transcriptase domain, Reverse transcriptase zinc-binding domain protein n=1 Tax=Tagetes erecta TaxID=13708 RepID=A0AAD8KVC0_TARER|nr:hypothetical protein QVD17_12069 [Tagetes erecta]